MTDNSEDMNLIGVIVFIFTDIIADTGECCLNPKATPLQ